MPGGGPSQICPPIRASYLPASSAPMPPQDGHRPVSPMRRVIAQAAAQDREGVGDEGATMGEGVIDDLIMVPLSGGPLLGVERV